MEPYYTAAFSLYVLEKAFRSGRLEPKYKPARFHILLAMRILGNPAQLSPMNSHAMEKYCEAINDLLWSPIDSDQLIEGAAAAVDDVAKGNFHRDNIRTLPFTENIITYCRKGA